ncbi:MAG: type III polyketide synthase [Phycisphaeraceae bacterium]
MGNTLMRIQGIGLATPGTPIKQTDLLDIAYRHNAQTRAERGRLERIYRGTHVDQRYSVLSGSAEDSREAMQCLDDFYEDEGHAERPGTLKRMEQYEHAVIHLAAKACQRALLQSDCRPEEITQLITVSCTGFSAPGMDLMLIGELGLDPCVGRTHVGFMGCHGAINGMRVADAFARADPFARVLLCCTELCTLHFQYGNDAQDAVANALFGDGAAALVGAGALVNQRGPRIKSFRSIQLPDTQGMMSWRIGNEGFRMRLSSQVPGQVKQQLNPFVATWLAEHGLSIEAVGGWCIHPGGPKVLDGVGESLGLRPEQTQASRSVLREYGNMSSPTVLFIAERMREADIPKPWVMLGFGPGLAIEACLVMP